MENPRQKLHMGLYSLLDPIFPMGDCPEHEWGGVMSSFGLLAAIWPLTTLGHYVHWHIIQISVANLTVIILMVVTFIVALFAPFPGRRRRKEKP